MKNIHEIEIKLEGKEWETALDKAFKSEVQKANVPGFRKGKVPKEVYLKKYGVESLFYTAINGELNTLYLKVLKDNKLEPIMDPNVDVVEVDEKKLVVKFTITTKPEVKIKKYKGLGVKKETVKVTKEEINTEIDNLRARFAELIIKDGKIESGDIAVIDFEGFLGKKAFEGGKGENYSLTIGSNTFIPGFEDQLIGHKAGDEVDVNVTFPEDYQSEELKGKKALFKVKIHEVKTKELPKLDEDFFLDLEMEGVNSEEKLKEVVEEQIKARKTYDIENKYVDDLLAEVAKNTEVEIPNELVEEEIDRMMHEYAHNLEHQGLTLEMFYKFTNSDEQALREQMRNDATTRVKYRFMLEEIASLENVKVTDKEVSAEADKLAKQYNTTKEEFLSHFGGEESLKYDMTMQKVIDIIKE
ncbi:MAG: trigger factor [Bacilli bacterium]|nr:trigger factor [Bacilli bacterium]